ncbi:MAG: 50S ribosome-binding GTPase [Kineosporiaceae bacterium]|nr:50S ribosome-binding GTPase [Aeromicrobium sp.]
MNATTDSTAKVFRDGQSDVSVRLDGLIQAVDSGRGRLDGELLAPAETIADRASDRLRLSGEHTIVALAGATGSGKSSLFNALTDLDLAGVGVRRPTTSWALACAWGPDGAEGLLEWMGIPVRHQVSRMSMLDRSSDDTKLDGLVLLDLPDHDSTEVSHHLEMDRLVHYADLLVWVLDPQKYADAAIHDRYIRPMASHVDVTIVVLNQIDRIPFEHRKTALKDVERILASGGLGEVLVIGVSATRGDGVDDLKRELAKRIRSKAAAKSRLSDDISTIAASIAAKSGTASVPGISPADRAEIDQALIQCAGVPMVVGAVASSTRRRAAIATGWPVARWLGRLRRDPLKDLDVGADMSNAALARSSIPSPTHVQRASAEVAIRDLAEKASVGLGKPWESAIRTASTAKSADIADALDQAVMSTDLGVTRPSMWWRIVNILQWLLFAVAVAGLGWLLVLFVAEVANFSVSDAPEVAGYPAPALLAVAGLAIGIVLAVLSRFAGRLSGRIKAKRADRLLRTVIGDVARSQVVEPIEAELAAYARFREGLLKAIG